jgi:cell fate regulator YaaT (PSP1 superfamily)
MTKVVGVRFRSAGKVYYFDPGDMELSDGDKVIVETIRGLECGEVVGEPRLVQDEEVTQPLKKVVRRATPEDECVVEQNREKEHRAFKIGLEKIAAHGLPMKLVDVEYTFDGSKIIFFFTADGRVDFRELVKDLAGVFHTRIELRQIGVRDEAKMIGGLGPCGRPLCCATFLHDFEPVSIRMAKDQSLSLNPAKISGICGRLMCCLKYEHEVYKDLRQALPSVGSEVDTEMGKGKIVELDVLKGIASVKLGDGKTVRVDVHRDGGPQRCGVVASAWSAELCGPCEQCDIAEADMAEAAETLDVKTDAGTKAELGLHEEATHGAGRKIDGIALGVGLDPAEDGGPSEVAGSREPAVRVARAEAEGGAAERRGGTGAKVELESARRAPRAGRRRRRGKRDRKAGAPGAAAGTAPQKPAETGTAANIGKPGALRAQTKGAPSGGGPGQGKLEDQATQGKARRAWRSERSDVRDRARQDQADKEQPERPRRYARPSKAGSFEAGLLKAPSPTQVDEGGQTVAADSGAKSDSNRGSGQRRRVRRRRRPARPGRGAGASAAGGGWGSGATAEGVAAPDRSPDRDGRGRRAGTGR